MQKIKYFLTGLIQAIVGTLVFVPLIGFGLLYGFGYSIWLSVTLKKWNAFLMYWLNIILGALVFIGRLLSEYAIALDIFANVNGEMVEDTVTSVEATMFGDANTTISASLGKLQIDNKLNLFGKIVSRILNIAFWQEAHCVDSWNYKIESEILKKKYFQPLKIRSRLMK